MERLHRAGSAAAHRNLPLCPEPRPPPPALGMLASDLARVRTRTGSGGTPPLRAHPTGGSIGGYRQLQEKYIVRCHRFCAAASLFMRKGSHGKPSPFMRKAPSEGMRPWR